MENYTKGKNVEEPLDKDKLPIPNLPKDFLWMQVQGGSKMRNLLELALKEYDSGKDVLWTGSGAAIGKVISCAEILKRKFKDVHQFNKIQYRRCEEYWDPKLEGLDQLVVNRDVPMIHILLSHEAINADLPGYQEPNKENKPRGNGRPNRPKKHMKPNISPQVEKAGLGFNKGKPKKNIPKQDDS
ncbi:unnamed protein product [Nezara viridula]|uniref:DNA/RNA-binding protein Alba-like domain-containing protein n=1 Tax=Nezara viridula TaxID=85310 RepID=A0A9P0HMP8_NEZVI|nr:unnamed protein product [Nezara viridula]